VSDGAKINMFPTDLHGPVGASHYVGSLRIAGRANQQVEQHQRIVLSDMRAEEHQNVYILGKNHMAELRDENAFRKESTRSAEFGFPLPAGVVGYRELRKIDHVDAGIHRVHYYKQVNHVVMPIASTLAHIHQYYAQWRINHGLETTLLLRS
jgi:hypothetical protein